MFAKQTTNEKGEINPLLIPLILAIVVALGLGGFAAWSFLQYTDHRDNVQSKVDVAVAQAKQDQQTADNKEFIEREKEPYRRFVGPEDLGRVEFDYPKTWSSYVDPSASNYQAIFHPVTVHSPSQKKPYALRLTIESRRYEDIVDSYQSRVRQGDMRSDTVTINGFNGIRLTGRASEQLPNATVVLFKVRDKTLQLATESGEYFADFDNIVLKNLRFNP